MSRWLALLAGLLLALPVAAAPEPGQSKSAQPQSARPQSARPRSERPLRVVSLNPCVDAILVAVADPGQIAALSHYSRDPGATAIPLAVAQHFPMTYETAEEVVALKPDVVLASAHSAPATRAALARMGARVVLIAVPDSIAQSLTQIDTIAAAVGQPARGAALVARIRQGVGRQALDRPAVTALFRASGGMVPGSGTLMDDLMRHTGFANASTGYGLQQWDLLSLEPLVAAPPRVLMTDARVDDPLARHPVFQRLKARMRVFHIAPELVRCGGPTILPALARLAAIRRSLP